MIKDIIIQAGGKGSRLEKYTYNKPKCLVSVNNLPIIFYIFKKFPDANFYIICDYKDDVLKKYLDIYKPTDKIRLIKSTDKGTLAGIKSSLEYIADKNPFMLIWSDLILLDEWNVPEDLSKNYVGISESFECRWSFKEKIFKNIPSKKYGVAGLFIFSNKTYLDDVPLNGEFVQYLSNKNIDFNTVSLNGTKEIGTILSYLEFDDRSNKCRPFNKMIFDNNIVTKIGINDQGRELAINEAAWYDKLNSCNYTNIPKIYNTNPIKMERINGHNIFEYENLSYKQKEIILVKIINALISLHDIFDEKECIPSDVIDTYLNKTFNRIRTVQNLIPFANDEYIKINGKLCKNIYYLYTEVKNKIISYMPNNFKFIHGDITFSNLMFDQFDQKIILIDPRGYFGKTKLYGDEYYDWAKLYYSIVGNYDQFNRKNFTLQIDENEVYIKIGSNNWEDMETLFFSLIPNVDKNKIKFLHALIWISLTTYTWDDYDSICGAFYNGVYYLNEVL